MPASEVPMSMSHDSIKLPTPRRHSNKLLQGFPSLLATAPKQLVVVPCIMLGVHLLAASQSAARFSMTKFNDRIAGASLMQSVLLPGGCFKKLLHLSEQQACSLSIFSSISRVEGSASASQ